MIKYPTQWIGNPAKPVNPVQLFRMSERRKPYPFDQIEPNWQTLWDERRAFRAPNPGEPGFDPAKPKFYILDMFPYPSGAGLHVGHPEGYTATDIVARYKRMRGCNVLHPMGWDAFGLPAEQYAIKTGQHPAITTRTNIAKFKTQLKRIGFSYDWEREISTAEPDFFRWTQWIFLQIYHSWFNPETRRAEPISTYAGADPDSVRLAYVAEVPVNWCPELGTVLANEEVIDGKSEVGGFPVVQATDAAMDAAHHGVCRAFDRRAGRAGLAGRDQASADGTGSGKAKARRLFSKWAPRPSPSSPRARIPFTARPTWCSRRRIRWLTRS